MSRSILDRSIKSLFCLQAPHSPSSKSLHSIFCYQLSRSYASLRKHNAKSKISKYKAKQQIKRSNDYSSPNISNNRQVYSTPPEVSRILVHNGFQSGNNPKLLEFRNLILSTDYDAVIDAYPKLLKLLSRNDTCEIARLLHHKLRTLKKAKKPVENITKRVDEFVMHYKKRRIPPHPVASVHIIGFYKESKKYDAGIEFWNWVVQQDDNYVRLNTYGAAIELLAVYGKSLSYCEEVYDHAVKRFPTAFNEYHLSHGAILPHRGLPVQLLGTSMTLLQGILTARLIHGDWRNAYLTLDTALRLHPTQIPNHFIPLFLDERPIHEGFQVFCLICESGNSPEGRSLTTMIHLLGSLQSADNDEDHRSHYTTSMVTALRSFLASGAKLNQTHMDVFLYCALQAALTRKTDEQIHETIDDEKLIKLISQVIAIFATLDVALHTQTFSNIITVAAKAQRWAIIAWAIELSKSYGIHLPDTIRRMYLIAAGKSRSALKVESAWDTHCQATIAAGAILTHNDWKALVVAVSEANNVELLHRQMISHAAKNDAILLQKIAAQLKEIPESYEEDSSSVTSEFRLANESAWFSKFTAELAYLQNLIAENGYRNLQEAPPVRDTIWALPQNVDEEWSRKLYDDLSLDPVDLDPAKTNSSMGPTGFKLDELRYRNWKAINQLLIQVELFEARVTESVDEAIEKGTSSEEARSLNYIRSEPKKLRLLSKNLEIHLQVMKDISTSSMTEAQWRDKIINLRRARS